MTQNSISADQTSHSNKNLKRELAILSSVLALLFLAARPFGFFLIEAAKNTFWLRQEAAIAGSNYESQQYS